MAAGGGGSRTRWTPRARTLAAIIFLVGAIVGFAAALLGAVCESPSIDCLRNEGKNAVRIAVVSAPFLVYAVHRFTRGGDHSRPPDDR